MHMNVTIHLARELAKMRHFSNSYLESLSNCPQASFIWLQESLLHDISSFSQSPGSAEICWPPGKYPYNSNHQSCPKWQGDWLWTHILRSHLWLTQVSTGYRTRKVALSTYNPNNSSQRHKANLVMYRRRNHTAFMSRDDIGHGKSWLWR